MILSQLGTTVSTSYDGDYGDYIRCNVNLLSTVLGWVFHCSYGQNIYKLFSAKPIVCHNDQILYAHYTGKQSRNVQDYNSVVIFVYPGVLIAPQLLLIFIFRIILYGNTETVITF